MKTLNMEIPSVIFYMFGTKLNLSMGIELSKAITV